jgi:hypothetical protein
MYTQQAKSLVPRAAMSSAPMWRERETAGPRSSRPILRWFTESFDTLDLKQAKAFLIKFIRCSALLLTPDGGYDLVKRPLQWRAHGPALVRVATTRSNPAGWAAPGASPVQFRLLRTCCIAAKPRAATG